MSAVMIGASSFETARSALPQDEEEMPRMWPLVVTLRRAEGLVSKSEARAVQQTPRQPEIPAIFPVASPQSAQI
jgi:hypothetical protein